MVGPLREEVPHEDGGVGVVDAGGDVGDPGLQGTPGPQLQLPEHQVCGRRVRVAGAGTGQTTDYCAIVFSRTALTMHPGVPQIVHEVNIFYYVSQR